jgi:hypothetical protein
MNSKEYELRGYRTQSLVPVRPRSREVRQDRADAEVVFYGADAFDVFGEDAERVALLFGGDQAPEVDDTVGDDDVGVDGGAPGRWSSRVSSNRVRMVASSAVAADGAGAQASPWSRLARLTTPTTRSSRTTGTRLMPWRSSNSATSESGVS